MCPKPRRLKISRGFSFRAKLEANSQFCARYQQRRSRILPQKCSQLRQRPARRSGKFGPRHPSSQLLCNLTHTLYGKLISDTGACIFPRAMEAIQNQSGDDSRESFPRVVDFDLAKMGILQVERGPFLASSGEAQRFSRDPILSLIGAIGVDKGSLVAPFAAARASLRSALMPCLGHPWGGHHFPGIKNKINSMSTSAELLEGLTLDGGWVVRELLPRSSVQTGGVFSSSYRIEHPDFGRKAFLKAMDFEAALTDRDPAGKLKELVDAFVFERTVVELCGTRKLLSRNPGSG